MLFNNLIQELASHPLETGAFNQYAPDNPNNLIRQVNLKLYLQEMQSRKPATLLVMEAPGYRGCRLTGVPVTSRKIMLEGVAELGIFGTDEYQTTEDEGFEKVYGEQSATIVWNTLAEIGTVPLIWNAFPFHPCKPDIPRSNRKPRKPELEIGMYYLQQVLQLYEIQQIIAIGNVAFDTLGKMQIDRHKVRHPAQGGKNDFVRGLTELLR